tara:strand:- start:2470 stop:3486 length:1017 start_codon:yes stop_codon:yes gene_type:complete
MDAPIPTDSAKSNAPSETGARSTLTLRLNAVTYEAEDILGFEFVDPAGTPLPAFTAGAHIDVQIAAGLTRQYSLAGDPADRDRYLIAVLNDPAGRGGSRAMHETLRPGQLVKASKPRNLFPLAADAEHHLLLAGGIGVTPMMAMIEELERGGVDWELHYCTRAPEKTAFARRLSPHVAAGRAHIHHDGGDPAKGLDIAELLRSPAPGTHLYYCGPTGFMAAVSEAAAGWPDGTVHFEYFAAPAGDKPDAGDNRAFQIQIKRTGEILDVPADKTIVDVLRDAGHYVDTSCEDGFCGTCLTPFSGGDPDHRDTVLDNDDRKRYVLICCSRAKTSPLILDL